MDNLYMDPLLTEIYNLLYRLGVRARILGFFETSRVTFLVMKQPERLRFSLRGVYQEVAGIYHIDVDVIEPHIRHVIRVIWLNKSDFLQRMLGEGVPLNKYPSPKQFIGILCQYLTEQRRNGRDR